MRVGDDEENPVLAAVAHLQLEPPNDGLDVGHASLGFDHEVSQTALLVDQSLDARIPCALVALDRQGDLVADAQGLRQSSTEAIQQPGLCRVPDRIASGVRPDPYVETDDRPGTSQIRGGHRWDEAALDAGQLRDRRSDRACDRPEGQASRRARVAQFDTDSEQVTTG